MKKKNYIKMNEEKDVQEVVENNEETKEESKMNFFVNHKKGLIIGGLGALAAGAVGLFLASKKSNDDDYESYDDFDDVDDTTTEESEEN